MKESEIKDKISMLCNIAAKHAEENSGHSASASLSQAPVQPAPAAGSKSNSPGFAAGPTTSQTEEAEVEESSGEKSALYNRLLRESHFLPTERTCTVAFLKDILSGKKKCLKEHQVIKFDPDLFKKYTLEMAQRKWGSMVKDYLPKKLYHRDRSFLLTIVNSLFAGNLSGRRAKAREMDPLPLPPPEISSQSQTPPEIVAVAEPEEPKGGSGILKRLRPVQGKSKRSKAHHRRPVVSEPKPVPELVVEKPTAVRSAFSPRIGASTEAALDLSLKRSQPELPLSVPSVPVALAEKEEPINFVLGEDVREWILKRRAEDFAGKKGNVTLGARDLKQLVEKMEEEIRGTTEAFSKTWAVSRDACGFLGKGDLDSLLRFCSSNGH